MEMKFVGILVIAALGIAGLYFGLQPQKQEFILHAPYVFAGQPQPASSDAPQGVELTVYQVTPQQYYLPASTSGGYDINNGVALVKETRTALFPQGLTSFSMKGTAQYIDSTSLQLKDSTDPDAQVLEQNYHYDLVSQDKLLQKYVDQNVEVVTDKATVAGKLLSSGNGLVIQTDKGITTLTDYKQINYPSLPEGLVTTPTIDWLLGTTKAGQHSLQASYLASGLNWHADYVAVTNADDSKIDLQGWVSLQNHAGATFTDATLKLVAGDINLVQPTQPNRYYDVMAASAGGKVAPAPQFAQENLFEYHLYTLQRPVTLKDNEDKQVSLMQASGVPVAKQLIFKPEESTKVQVKLQFDNKKASGLGLPMPKGKVRVYKPDSTGQLQFLGEDQIDHTPEDEKVRVFVGNAFDVVVDAKQTNYQQLGECSSETSYSVEVRNHKKEAITLMTFSPSLYTDWEITKENLQHTKDDAQHALWNVNVPADGTQTLAYTVRQRWC